MKRVFIVLAGAFLLLASGKTVSASTITFTFTGTGSGGVGGTDFVGGTGFTDAAFTITAVADTSGRVGCGAGCFFIDSTSSTIAIAGFALAGVTSGTRVFDAQTHSALGYSRAGISGADLLDMFHPSFSGYDLSTSFGPVFNAGPLALGQFQCSFGCVTSNLGNIEFSRESNVTFTATTGAPTGAPEPATFTLLGIGSLGIGLVRRLRRKA